MAPILETSCCCQSIEVEAILLYSVILFLYLIKKNTIMSGQEYLSQHLLWIGVSLGIVFAILSYVPFPFSIPFAIASFFIVIFYLRKRVIKRIKNKTIMFRSSNNNNQSLNYYCMACGAKHNEAACPKCGSKAKRVG
jgi:hypothetical protein